MCWYCQLACGAVLFLEILKIDKIPFSSTSACGSSGSLSAVLRRPEGPSQPPGGLGRPPSRPGAAGARGVAYPPPGYAPAVCVAGTCRRGRGSAGARKYCGPSGDARSVGLGRSYSSTGPPGHERASALGAAATRHELRRGPAPYAAVAIPGPRQVPIGSSMPGDLFAASCYYHTHVPPGTGSTSLLITSTTYV